MRCVVGLCLWALLAAPLAGYATEPTIYAITSGPWSQVGTWSDCRVPKAGDSVLVPPGITVTYDVTPSATPPRFPLFQVQGTVEWATTRSTQMDVGLLLVEDGGTLRIGRADAPLPPDVTATIRLTDFPEVTYDHLHGQANLPPALHTHGGRLELYGAPHAVTWTRLAQNAPAGTTTLIVEDFLDDWRPGDRIVVSGTNKMYVKGQTAATRTYEVGACDVRTHDQWCLDPTTFQAEEATVASVGGTTLMLTAPLAQAHLGTAPRQAAVGLLSRNIVITSATPTGRRGHVMIAHGFVVPDTSPLPDPLPNPVTAILSQVEFAYLGRPEPGIYPVHFHRLGNNGVDSALLGSSIHHSKNLFVRVHTTNFLTVADNVGYDTLGHGFATEDGAEMHNRFINNLAMRTKAHPVKTNPNDPTDDNEGSGFWLNNPGNRLVGNMATDGEAWGYQIDPKTSYPDSSGIPQGVLVPVVDSYGKAMPPQKTTSIPLLEFTDNTSHGHYRGGAEVKNLDTATETRLTRYTAVNGRISNLSILSTRVALDTPTLLNGGPTWPGDFSYGDLIVYHPGNFAGVPLSLPPRHTFRGGRIDDLHVPYQFDGPLLLDSISLGKLRPTGYGDSRVIVVKGQPRFEQLVPHLTQSPLGSSTQHEVYLFDHDGPGKHVKLIPAGMVSADTLSYKPSRYWSPEITDSYQEAAFTGTDGPPLTLPLYLNIGNNQDVVNPAAGGHDQMVNGKRWRIDSLYTEPPAGFVLPRYGHDLFAISYGWASLPPLLDASIARLGPMVYKVDVPNGTYQVDLTFAELAFVDLSYLSNPGVGTRLFAVGLEGTQVETGIDVFAAVGNYAPLVKSFPVTVTDGQLTVWISQNGTLSALAVCRPDQVVGGRC